LILALVPSFFGPFRFALSAPLVETVIRYLSFYSLVGLSLAAALHRSERCHSLVQ
jgi:hypothetical protein